MHRILLTACAALALAACGDTQDADENPTDLNVVDNVTAPGNVAEPPTGAGPTVTPTGNGILIEPGGNAAVTGNTTLPAGNGAAPAGNSQ